MKIRQSFSFFKCCQTRRIQVGSFRRKLGKIIGLRPHLYGWHPLIWEILDPILFYVFLNTKWVSDLIHPEVVGVWLVSKWRHCPVIVTAPPQQSSFSVTNKFLVKLLSKSSGSQCRIYGGTRDA